MSEDIHTPEGRVKAPSEDRRVHDLKCWPPYYMAIVEGRKHFEVRKHDRDFQPGDKLWLREFSPVPSRGYTGRHLLVRVKTVWPELPGLLPGHCAMDIEVLP